MRIHFFVLFLGAPLTAQTLLSAQPIDIHSIPPLGALANCAAAGDVDGDGDDDIAVTEGIDAVVYHQQAGQFVRSLVFFDVTTSPKGVAVADFDHDGHQDLMFGPYGSQGQPTLRVWWGDGSGLFQAAPTTSINIDSYYNRVRFVVGDVDNDNDVDVVLTCPSNGFPHSCLLMRNTGARTFAEAPAAQFPRLDSGDCWAHLADLDADGRPEVVVVSRTARSRIYWNNAGNFAEATLAQFPLLQRSLRGFAAADLDGDGSRDLVFGGDVDTGVAFRRTAARQFTLLGGTPPPPARCVALHVADVDGDQRDDVYFYRTERGQLRRSNGLGGWPLVEEFGGSDGTEWVAPMDLDDDGDQDLLRLGRANVVSGTQPPATVAASFAVDGRRFEHLGGARLSTSTTSVISNVGDIDGNGVDDIAMTAVEPNGQGYLQFAKCDGHGKFGFDFAPRLNPTLERTFFADLDGDGRDEYVMPSITTFGYLANVQGQMATTVTPIPITGMIRSGTGIDIDGDLDQDLLLLEQWGTVAHLRALENVNGGWQERTAQWLSAPALSFSTTSSLRAFPADLDADGDADVVAGSDTHVLVLRNQGGVLTFVPGAMPYLFGGDYPGSFADLDGDGDLDLTWGAGVFRNVGQCLFTQVTVGPFGSGTSLGLSVDVDDDGDVDLVGHGFVAWNNGNMTFTAASGVVPMVYGSGAVFRWLDSDRDGDPDMIGYTGTNGRTTHYTNMLRQFWFASPGRLGGNLDFRFHAQPGQQALPILVWFGCSFGRTTPILHPDFGWQVVDATQMITLGPFALPAAGGDVLHSEPLPNIPAMLGVYLCAQPIELRGSRIRLGNFVETWLGR
jgi:hypothetical protein